MSPLASVEAQSVDVVLRAPRAGSVGLAQRVQLFAERIDGVPLRVLEPLQQGGTGHRHGYHADQHLGVFGGFLVGLATFLALLPRFLALACQHVLVVELAFPHVNGILHHTLVRGLLTADYRHQSQVVHVAVAIGGLHLVSIGSSYRQHTTQHRHVHRLRHTHQTLPKTYRQVLRLKVESRQRSITITPVKAKVIVPVPVKVRVKVKVSVRVRVKVSVNVPVPVKNIQRISQSDGEPVEFRRQCISDFLALLLQRESVVAGDHLVEPFEVTAADVPQVARQLVGQRVAVAFGRFIAVVVNLPVFRDDLREGDAVVFRGVLAGAPAGFSGSSGDSGFSGFSGDSGYSGGAAAAPLNPKNLIIQEKQLRLRRGEEHPRDVLRTRVILHAQQVARPLQVLLLAQRRLPAEHQVVAFAAGTLLQHQQA